MRYMVDHIKLHFLQNFNLIFEILTNKIAQILHVYLLAYWLAHLGIVGIWHIIIVQIVKLENNFVYKF